MTKAEALKIVKTVQGLQPVTQTKRESFFSKKVRYRGSLKGIKGPEEGPTQVSSVTGRKDNIASQLVRELQKYGKTEYNGHSVVVEIGKHRFAYSWTRIDSYSNRDNGYVTWWLTLVL